MAATQFNASILVNRGLEAMRVLADPDPGSTPTVGVDVLGAFRDIALSPQAQAAAPELAGIIGSFASPIDVATWAINAKFAEAGGADGALGRPLSAAAAAAHAGFSRAFQSGEIYWHPSTGAHALHGPILARWHELGGEAGFLGFPTSDVMPGSDVRAEGFFAHFQGGSIYWAPPSHFSGIAATVSIAGAVLGVGAATAPAHAPTPLNGAAAAGPLGRDIGTAAAVNPGAAINGHAQIDLQSAVALNRPIIQSSAGAFELHGAIREKYLALGAEASILGYPRTDETGTPDGRGRFNHFQGGSIYWTAETGAHEVHGLIRDRWSALGGARNPQLGYPIGDELIPDPRVGHRRPEAIKKPIASLPAEVVKLPAAAIAAGFPASVVNTPPLTPTASAAARVAAPGAAMRLQDVGVLGPLSTQAAAAPSTRAAPNVASSVASSAALNVSLDPAILGILTGPASTPGQRSVNRFADFESGVLFWYRGATSASVLTPLPATSDGTSLAFSGNDIAALAVARLGRNALEFANAQLLSMSFIGTTAYSHDGAQVHNRRHRLQLILQGVEQRTITGPLGVQLPQMVQVTAGIELQVEVWFDAAQRRIALALVDWDMSQASTQSYAAVIEAGLRGRLDPLLWQSYEVMTLPDTDGGAAMAVLSVKTLANGAVVVFVEPRHFHLLDGIGDLANVAAATVVQLTQPN
ncbi:hypothetical protein [Roseateles sp.]|uniref:LGFP repeat-containing protein n=1 Tax=Roseateles sp. TaxID=1971397 RepID=UPI0025D81BD2|nr:hypothetical protein [Roseateles sp.]MBV8037114.1 hypothetical protein [Roseateles sp.]